MEDIHGQKYTQEYLDSHLNKEEHTQTKKGKKKLRPWRIPPSRPPLPEQRASVSEIIKSPSLLVRHRYEPLMVPSSSSFK